MATTPFASATMAYGNAAKLIANASRSPAETLGTAGPGGDFAKLLGESLQGVVDSGRASDAKMMDMVNGRADVVDVVTAVAQTEVAI